MNALRLFRTFSLLWLALFATALASAATTTVNSVTALQTAINNAASGDVLVLADGIYTTNNTLTISKSNITVRAATPGGVVFSAAAPHTFNGVAVTKDGASNITISGNNVTFSGFQFKDSYQPDTMINVSGNNNTITQCNWSNALALRYINLNAGSHDNVISYCNMEKKGDNGIVAGDLEGLSVRTSLIQISVSETVPGFHKIRYCSFQDICPTGTGGDFGNEPIRIGLSTTHTFLSRTTVEYCYFNNTGAGDSEAVSIKSRENVVRYCTFDNNPSAMLVFRSGDDCAAYGNFFINGSAGIRVKESNNAYCYNNYFETGSATPIQIDFVAAALSNSGTDQPDNANFIHNTFYNCAALDLGGTGPTNITFANNIFRKSSGNLLGNANTSTTWVGNIYSGTLGISTPSGMTRINPLLTVNADGFSGLPSNSPAINAAGATIPIIPDIAGLDDDSSILLDISGQARPASATLKDVGCDEFADGTTTNRPLTLAKVGPAYLGGPTGALESPSFATQPQSQGVVAGNSATFTAAATGTPSLLFQWKKNGADISGATSVSYSIPATVASDAGTYTLVVTNSAGSVTSSSATLSVSVAAPALTTQPVSQIVTAGGPVSFTAAASGSPTLSFQWKKGGVNIPGATSAGYTIASAVGSDAGIYTVLVTNSAGSATSSSATLTVNKVVQTITFAPISDLPYTAAPITLVATASSGLPINFTVVSGPANVSGQQITLTGTGIVTLRASQTGDGIFLSASAVERTVSVTANLASWQLSSFTAAELADPGRSGPLAIYGTDNLPNLIKYALGLEPKQNCNLPVSVTANATDWVFTYTRPSSIVDVVYKVEVSTDLATWNSANVVHELVSSANGTDTWRARLPLLSTARVFFHLVVSLP
ncbi:hypothetical protein IMCC26134_04675 [Verrucomicrobia bacterium IMCC26134]|nr:hypothetical protein IMCC26134_04675 [Verrucomicrobia bacterium IMCC26134]